MLTGLVVVAVLSPCLAVLALLALAEWRERVRDHLLTRQAALTDAIHRELGAVVSPVVTKRRRGPWQIRIAVPLARPAAVAAVLAIVHRELDSNGVAPREDYQIVLTRQPDAPPPRCAAAGRSPVGADIATTAQVLALLEKGLTHGRQ